MTHELSKSAVVSVLSALIQDELQQLRKDHQRYPLSADTQLVFAAQAKGGNELLVDSFEWMALATRVVNFFSLDSSGLEDYLLRYKTLDEWAEVVVKSRELASTDIRFQTSGSTGAAKTFSHSYATLLHEVSFFADYLPQHNITIARVVSLVPAHHVYGFLFSVLLPDVLGIPVVRGLSAMSQVQGERLEDGDLVVAYPAVLKQFSERQFAINSHAHIVTSTGPCPPNVVGSMLDQGAASVIEVYGSTDSGGVGVRVNQLSAAPVIDPPYQLLPRWQRLSASCLHDSVQQQSLELPDKLEWIDEIHFKPCGRIDQAVVVQGINVYPKHIAEVFTAHPEVAEARVRLLSEDNSQGLKALVVPAMSIPANKQQAWLEDVLAFAAAQLKTIEVPKRLAMALAVPTNDMGKEIDWDTLESE